MSDAATIALANLTTILVVVVLRLWSRTEHRKTKTQVDQIEKNTNSLVTRLVEAERELLRFQLAEQAKAAKQDKKVDGKD